MPSTIEIVCGADRFTLLAQRAVWRAADASLFIADPHFGKAAAYRALGQPVPAGTTRQTLARLDGILSQWPARRLVILGDFLHAKAAHAPATLAELAQWRARHASLACVLVRGNHDDRAGDPPASLRIAVVDEPYDLGGVGCYHHPPGPAQADAAALSDAQGEPGAAFTYCLAGHVHPVIVLRGRGRDSARLPCFDMGSQVGVLPAFGAFTGGHAIEAEPGRRRFAVADDQIFAL